MAHWREEYSAALASRDRREKANTALYDAYTQLADRTASTTTTSLQTPAGEGPRATTTTRHHVPPPTPSAPTPPAPQQEQETLLALLAAAQRSRSELQAQLTRMTAELERLRKRHAQDGRRLQGFEQEVAHLQMRLKDRDEELRGKAKLLEDFQDEMASLNLQLNMAEERSARFQQENQDLVDRWMAKVGQEADAMNANSRFS
ncbi:ATG16 family protein [Aspergillus brunneoviolaceus CBS 621.78]|uniref:Autophagy protein 16 n=1 Tax=Aspergillus brunneoviolaceus CBS 621.78 TaxID=1450534 RepID=A0ACD1FTR6_9EURO|nr:autophagy protein 16 [Aspergillus brunneoviolaceus CBS 621.78]RAH40390.1 autophagy protein 16 [Aspergillus brunneoviolaceus CBS 621.78]